VIVGRTRNSTPWPWLACVDGLVGFECFANEACKRKDDGVLVT
jgi:hypothetical protein